MTETQEPDETKPPQTPLTSREGDAVRYPEKRKPRRLVAIFFLLLAVCAVMTPVLLANGGRNLHSVAERFGVPLERWLPARPAPAETHGEVHPAETPAGAEPAASTAHPPMPAVPVPAVSDPPTRLSRPADPWAPEPGCHALEPGVTGEKPVFLRAPDGRWECTVLIVMSEAAQSGSMFIQARGAGNDVASLRMKLNFGDDAETSRLAARATALAHRVLVSLNDDEIAYIETKMADRQAFRTETGDYRLTFRQEGSATQRFNLIAVPMAGSPIPGVEENTDSPDVPLATKP